MPVNWNLFTPVDISGKFQQGWEQGAALREKRDLKSALAAYSANPSDPAAQSALARVSPQFAMKMAENQWELQQKAAERARIGALLGDDPSSIPPGLNGKPAQINYRQRQQVALRAGDTAAAAALGAMADDQERQSETQRKATEVTSKLDTFSGKIYYFNQQGDLIGDDTSPYVRGPDGKPYKRGKNGEPVGYVGAPAPSSGQMAPAVPSGDPLAPIVDPRIASAPKAKILADALAMVNSGTLTPEQEAAMWAEAAKYDVYPPGSGAPQ